MRRGNGALAAAVLPMLALIGIGMGPLTAQSSSQKPVMTIQGPQGIGMRVGPVPAEAPRFEAASIRRDASGEMAPTSQGQLVHVTGQRLVATIALFGPSPTGGARV